MPKTQDFLDDLLVFLQKPSCSCQGCGVQPWKQTALKSFGDRKLLKARALFRHVEDQTTEDVPKIGQFLKKPSVVFVVFESPSMLKELLKIGRF